MSASRIIELESGEVKSQIDSAIEGHADAVRPELEMALANTHIITQQTKQRPQSPSQDPDSSTKKNNPPVLLTLPLEVRLLIYDHLLTAKYDNLTTCPWPLTLDNGCILALDSTDTSLPLQVHPSILRTCRQIHAEARTILYAHNPFYIHDASAELSRLQTLAPQDLRTIRTLDLWIQASIPLHVWLRLLRYISLELTGLATISIEFSAKFINNQTLISPGLGANLSFARAFAHIKGLTTLRIEGYYAKNWPAYFREAMACEVIAYTWGQRLDHKLPERWKQGELKLETARFVAYQQMAGELDPASSEVDLEYEGEAEDKGHL